MMWRHENWERIKNQDITGRDNIHYCAGFEAGANAMLNTIIDQLESCESEEDKLFFVYQLIHDRIKEEQSG